MSDAETDDYFPFEGSPEVVARVEKFYQNPEGRAFMRRRMRNDLVRRLRGHIEVMEAFPDLPQTTRSMAGLKQSLELMLIHLAHEEAADVAGGHRYEASSASGVNPNSPDQESQTDV